jgi:hypothetical protein
LGRYQHVDVALTVLPPASIDRRYAIVDEAMLRQGATKLSALHEAMSTTESTTAAFPGRA